MPRRLSPCGDSRRQGCATGPLSPKVKLPPSNTVPITRYLANIEEEQTEPVALHVVQNACYCMRSQTPPPPPRPQEIARVLNW